MTTEIKKHSFFQNCNVVKSVTKTSHIIDKNKLIFQNSNSSYNYS